MGSAHLPSAPKDIAVPELGASTLWRALSAALVSLLVLPSCLSGIASASDELRIGLYENPPKIFRNDDGRPAGFWPDVIDALAARLDRDFVYVDCRWDQCLDMLAAGEIDVMPDVARTSEREARFQFGQYPVLFSWSVVVVPNESPVKSVGDLAGRRIAAVSGSVQEARLRAFLGGRDIEAEIDRVNSMVMAIENVLASDADAAITNNFFATEALRNSALRALDEPFGGSGLHFAFAPGINAALIDSFDLAVFQLQNAYDSPIAAAMDQWLPDKEAVIPRWLWIGIAALGFLLATMTVSWGATRRLVRQRTAELERTVQQLSDALAKQRDAEQRAMDQRNLEALGQLVGGVAHDFNNLLTVIIGNLDQAAEGDVPEKELSAIRTALDAAERGGGLTRQLLAFGRQAPLRPDTVDLNATVMETADLLRRTLLGQIEIQNSLASTDIHIRVDANSLKNALLNLALNARDAIEGSGWIEMRTRIAHQGEDLIPDAGSHHAGYAIIEFRDNGAGMPSETANRVFEPFFTTKQPGRGTGMGLSMVQGFVKQSGGSISVESVSGEGTTFRIALPLADATASPARITDIKQVGGFDGRKFLLVEDDPEVLSTIRRYLTSTGCEVTTAPDGMTAWRMIENGLSFDCLISDISMPGEIQGLELARRVNARFPSIPVILISGYSREMAQTAEEDLPQADFIEKPVRRNELISTVSQRL